MFWRDGWIMEVRSDPAVFFAVSLMELCPATREAPDGYLTTGVTRGPQRKRMPCGPSPFGG